MRRQSRSNLLLVTACLFVFVSGIAGDKKDKVAIVHNGHIITVAPEAVPAHLAHGDTFVTNDVAIVYINHNADLGTVTGPATVPSGGSATFEVIPFVLSYYTLVINGNVVMDGVGGGTFNLDNVTAPLTVEVTFEAIPLQQ